METIINQSLNNSLYHTITNATTPAVAVDSSDNVIYVVYFKNETNGTNIYLQKSTDLGKTFNSPVKINHGNESYSIDDQWTAPGLAIGPNSTVHVVWYKADYDDLKNFPEGHVMLRYAKSDDGGLSFSIPINPAPNDPQGKQDYPFLTVSPDNHVYISCLNLPSNLLNDISGPPSVLRVVTSEDGGNTFKNSTIIDHSACQCCATVVKFGPDNQVYVTSRSTFKNHSIALDDSNTPYQFPDGENQTTIRDITVSHSTDGSEAQNFSKPMRVGNDRWFMNGCPDSGPGIDFDKNGTMHIAWFTGSESAPQGPGFYYTTSNDDGATFGKPIPIHLLSEQWIPPTTQYLKTDKYGNSWMVFVNSEGLEKSDNWIDDRLLVGHGSIHLSVVDQKGNILKSGNFAIGDINKHYPFTAGSDDLMVISWIDGTSVRLASIPII